MLVMLLMTVSMGAVLLMASLFLRELKLANDVRFSVQAFYAAETGVERFVWEYRRNNLVGSDTFSCTAPCLSNGTTYEVVYDFLTTANIVATGFSHSVKRALLVSF